MVAHRARCRHTHAEPAARSTRTAAAAVAVPRRAPTAIDNRTVHCRVLCSSMSSRSRATRSSPDEDFKKDPRPHKINLSIGIYFDDAGRIPVLDSVRRAEQQVVRARRGPSPTCRSKARPTSAARCRRCCSAPATRRSPAAASRRSSRSARAAASRSAPTSSRRWLPGSGVWVSDPSWDNHRSMFEGAGLAVHDLSVLRRRRPAALRFARCCEALARCRASSVVLLHACCHNPTGVDLTPAQWDALIPLLVERELIALPRPRLPGLRRRHRRRRLRGARAGAARDAAAGRVLRRQLVLQEHEPVRRALRRAQRRLRRRAREAEQRARPAQVHGAPQLLEPADPRRPDRRRRARPSRRCGATWEAELAAMRERIQAMRKALHGVLARRCRSATSATS